MSINHQHEIPRPEPSARETWGLKGNEAEGIRSEVDWARGAGSLSMQLLLPAARPVAFAIPFGVSQLPDTATQHPQLVSCQLKQGAVACW